jgi:L,D-transpeptidase catalytic domain
MLKPMRRLVGVGVGIQSVMRRLCVAVACVGVLIGSSANADTRPPELVIKDAGQPEVVIKDTDPPEPVIKDTRPPELVIKIDKSSQRMSVLVDGQQRHAWAISSGLEGGPPTGTYKPYRVHRHWFSRKYQWSPMPHSIFFHEGYAIHGTTYVRRLGRPASHGCIRLHPDNAAALFALVKEHGRDNTRIEVEGAIVMAKAKAKPRQHHARKKVFVKRVFVRRHYPHSYPYSPFSFFY